VATTLNVAVLPTHTAWFIGAVVITGTLTSFTVIVNVQVTVPQIFVAVAVTVVTPTGKLLPDAIE
jgi:hypothetical protein